MRRIVVIVIGSMLVAGCAAPTDAPAGATTTQTPRATPAATIATAAPDPWAEDLAFLDAAVRQYHPDPFAINPESAWTAKLAELATSLPTATPDEQLVQLATLTGLLDTHSWLDTPRVHAYGALFYPFADGWFTIRATDPTLVGTRLVSIGGTPIEEIEAALRPLVPADNESGELDGLQGLVSFSEYLHGLGIVEDVAHPAYVLARPDGSTVEVDLPIMDPGAWEQELGVVGGLIGEAPEAVARRKVPVWTRLDPETKTFLLSFNDYEDFLLPIAMDALITALHDGSAERVVVDLRYLRGGNSSLADPLITALASDPLVNEPGALTVLIGRENVSAGTIVAGALDRRTTGVLVGEPTPARADNFLCDCHDIVLPNSGFVAGVPTVVLRNGDTRDAVVPDVPMVLSSTDFFAGRDPVLDAALSGEMAAP